MATVNDSQHGRRLEIVATGDHFVLDALGGVAIATVALATEHVLSPRRPVPHRDDAAHDGRLITARVRT